MVARAEGWPVIKSGNIAIGNPDSQVAIATLWTKMEQITGVLDSKDYAVVGQLYEPYGISFAVRNLLANANIRHLVVGGADLSGSGEALAQFWANGVDHNHNVVGVQKVPIQKELPQDALDRLRQNVSLHDLRSVKNSEYPSAIRQLISTLPQLTAWGDAEVYPIPELKAAEKMPGEDGAVIVRGKYVWDTYVKMLDEIMRRGEDAGTNYGNTARDRSNLIAIVSDEDPDNPKVEDVFNFTEKELGAYVEEWFDARLPEGVFYTYANRLRSYENRAQLLFEGYRNYIQTNFGIQLPETFEFDGLKFEVGGPRNIDQAKIIIEKLKKDRNDRGALALLYDPLKDNQVNSAIPLASGFRNPCDALVQASVKNSMVEVTAYFRSNDMYGAWPRNAFGLRAFQAEIAKGLGLPLGALTTISMRAHIYTEAWPSAAAIIENYGDKVHGFVDDPRGNLIIQVDNQTKEIKLLHTEPSSQGGMPLGPEITGDGQRVKGSQELMNRIIKQGRISSLEHAGDIGRQLAFAEIAAKFGFNFKQDSDNVIAQILELAEKARKYDHLVEEK